MAVGNCAACGKPGKRLKMCGRCGEVAYCGPDCQKKHWKQQHKSVCLPKLRFKWGDRVSARVGAGTEWDWAPGTVVALRMFGVPYSVQCDDGQLVKAPEDDDRYVVKLESPDLFLSKDPEAQMLHEKTLFNEEPPVDDECPVCCLRYPLSNETAYQPCCGQLICIACAARARANATTAGGGSCPFCRASGLADEDIVQRVKQRAEAGNANDLQMLGNVYDKCMFGMPRDPEKAHELWTQAAELGDKNGHWYLYQSYSEFYKERGVEKDMAKAIFHLEMAAIKGDPRSRCMLGCYEAKRGNLERAKKHWMHSASAGCDSCMRGAIKVGFEQGHVTEEEYIKTERAHKHSVNEMKSTERDSINAYQKHLDDLQDASCVVQ